MGWKVTPYDDNLVNHIYPEDESHSEDYFISVHTGMPISHCHCRPDYTQHHPKQNISIVHSSFDGREYVERAQSIINGIPS